MKLPQKEKQLHLELLRILAAFFVIFNHTGLHGFFLFSERTPGSVSYWLYLALTIFCTVSVPLFFAISGALMLPRAEEPLRKLWGKRIAKMVLIVIVFSLVSALVDCVRLSQPLSVSEFLRSMYIGMFAGKTLWYGHLWYLYAYIAYLMCLPFLRAMVQKLENKQFVYLIGLAVLFSGVIPALEFAFFEGNTTMYQELRPQWLLYQIVLYPCVGYFLEHRLGSGERKKLLPVLWIAAILGIAATGWLIGLDASRTGILTEQSAEPFFDMFVLLSCMAVYVTGKTIAESIRIPGWLKRAALSVGSCTFGIYLIHLMVLESAPMTALFAYLTGKGIPNMISCLIQCAAVMAVSYGITWILRKIPGIRMLVGG